jgi:hypothetical protein
MRLIRRRHWQDRAFTMQWPPACGSDLPMDRDPRRVEDGSYGRSIRSGAPIAFHLALCVDGVGVTLYALAVLAGLVLLRAERRAVGEQARSQPKHPVQVRS